MMRQSCSRVTPHHPLESIACQNIIEGILVKAVRTHGRGGPEQLFFEDVPLPEVRRGDVLVQVRATGITPAELTWDETYQNADGGRRSSVATASTTFTMPAASAGEALLTTVLSTHKDQFPVHNIEN
jgi:hypothetical protein